MHFKKRTIKMRMTALVLCLIIFGTSIKIAPVQASTQTSIKVETQGTKEQMISFYEDNFPESYPQEYIDQGIELADFVDIIIEEATTEEVRADLAFIQVLIETNNLQFDGEFSIEKNNFGNLQEADGEYITYDSIADGIRANISLLKNFESGNWFEKLEYSATVNEYLEEILNTNVIEEPEQQEESEDFEEDLSEDIDVDNEVIIRDNSANSISNVKVELETEDKQTNFTKSDKYFKVDENTPIYDNRTGSLIKVGELTKGQVYPRTRDYGANWHEIQFGNIKGYISKADTSLATGNEIKNKNTSRKNQALTFKTLSSAPVYDNTSGSLVEFATIDKGKTYPVAFDYGNWFGIILSDRIGYVHKDNLEVNFLKSDKYFRVKNNTPIYDNRTGSLIKVGELTKGESYPRVRDYGANWHEIQFGKIKGYVSKADTSLSTGKEIKNKNTSRKNQARTFKTLSSVPVYDNTSGSLVQFATIDKGKTYPVAFDYGNWFGIILSDRIGYVHKDNLEVSFLKSDKYFKVKENTPIYDNRTGSLVKVGELTKGQVYPRTRDYGANWHEIQFGNIKGYVSKADTSLSTGKEIKNKNTSRKNQARTFKTLSSAPIYDNTSGSLVEFATIDKGKTYPVAFDYGNWLGIILSDRVGYIHKDNVEMSNFTIYLDPGHGGSDPGANYDATSERNLNLIIANKVANQLRSQGHNVVMSRTTNNSPANNDLYERAARANAAGADIYISIHHNAMPGNSGVTGIETYYYISKSQYPPLPGNATSHNNPTRLNNSKELANSIHNELIKSTGANNRGVKRGSYVVLRETKMPAVLLELGFMTNPTELNRLRSESYQNTMTNAIVKGINDYFDK